MKYHAILICSLVGLMSLSSCTEKQTVTSHSRQEGEDCDTVVGCLEGLYCEDGRCRRVCHEKADCNSGYTCLNSRCVIGGSNNDNDNNNDNDKDNDNPGSNTDQSQTVREEAEMPAGGVFTPMSATVSNQRYRARVMGGALQQHVSNDTNSAIVQDGTWKAE